MSAPRPKIGYERRTTGLTWGPSLHDRDRPALRTFARNARRAITEAAKQAGLPPICLHSLRHSAASVMITEGIPLKVVSDLLGHSSISITADVYGHVAPEVARSAIDTLSSTLEAATATHKVTEASEGSLAVL